MLRWTARCGWRAWVRRSTQPPEVSIRGFRCCAGWTSSSVASDRSRNSPFHPRLRRLSWPTELHPKPLPNSRGATTSSWWPRPSTWASPAGATGARASRVGGFSSSSNRRHRGRRRLAGSPDRRRRRQRRHRGGGQPDRRLRWPAAGGRFGPLAGWRQSPVGAGLPEETSLYRSVRPVDYCSGCGLLVPLSDWRALGGLDEAYYPAYHEDVDLCLALKKWPPCPLRAGGTPPPSPRRERRRDPAADLRRGPQRRALPRQWAATLVDTIPPATLAGGGGDRGGGAPGHGATASSATPAGRPRRARAAHRRGGARSPSPSAAERDAAQRCVHRSAPRGGEAKKAAAGHAGTSSSPGPPGAPYSPLGAAARWAAGRLAADLRR